MSEETGGNLPAQSDPDGQLELWGEMLAVERERIASRDALSAGGFPAVGFFLGRRSRA